jgi:prepilin-type N-terminal cleavage/methylation domain-containing protein
MTIECQGRDGSPQPSQNSGATRRHPRRLRLKNRVSRRSAPTFVNQVTRSTPFISHSVFSVSSVVKSSSSAFTLLEVLVATAVLALMMTFLFNLLGSSAKLWEIGNKKIEAAQAARVGLNIMAKDLKNAFAGNMTSFTSTGNATYNIAPFLGVDSSDTSVTGALSGNAKLAEGSDKLFGVRLTINPANTYDQFGYQCVFIDDEDGFKNMRGYRYYLVSQNNDDDFYFRNSNATSSTNWYSGNSTEYPIIDNCIRVKFSYYGNQTSLSDQITANGTRSFTTNGTWSANATTAHLPLGVLVTISILDSKTAEKIAAIKGVSALTSDEIDNGLTNPPPSNLSTVERLISQGSVTMSRFIPLNSQ